mmetsp:Transcript_29673/g.83375  ORF Transcript_29673/g.83375 Transcript_29673/m.83375 type:complete len:227 (-) Transcript_29673:53-733(-)
MHVVYCVERAVACVDFPRADSPGRAPGHRDQAWQRAASSSADVQFVLLVDFAGYSRENRPPLRTLREIVAVLQAHYPERLGHAYLINPPLQVVLLWRTLSFFVNAGTYNKVQIIQGPEAQLPNLLKDVFDEDCLEHSLGGKNALPFDSEVFLKVQPTEGSVYGAEFDSQLAASQAASLAASLDASPKEGNDAAALGATAWVRVGWKHFFALESLFGGGAGQEAPLW